MAVNVRALGSLEVHNGRGEELRVLHAQPKRLALFIYMALSGSGTLHSREKLCAMFWPESPEDLARLSLRQALHFLRKAAGSEIIASRSGDEIGVSGGAVRSDVADLETAIAEQRRSDAIALYRGPFLQDFRVTGVSSEFEWWVDRQRTRLHELVIRAAQELVQIAERDGDLAAAVRSASDVTRLAPFDEPALRRLVTLLDRAGDRASALQAYETFAALLERELESSPSAETRALITRLRVQNRREPNELTVPAAHANETSSAVPVTTVNPLPPTGAATSPRARFISRRVAALVLISMAALASVALAALRERASAVHVVLAVGEIRSRARDTLLAPGLIRELLASDLARIDGIDVVSAERMQELIVQLGPAADTAAVIANAARRAGATQMLQAILSGGGGSPLRLDVRRADLADGTIHGAVVIEADDVFSLADQLSARVAADFGRRFPGTPLTDVRSRSLVAGRLYEEGARAFYQGDAAGGLRLFDAALREDSTFTMAALFAEKAAWDVDGDTLALRYLGLARRAARRAPERERLLVETEWARRTNSPNAVAVAESLATRYPSEPAGESALGDALVWTGDRERAIPHLRLAIESDSTGLSAAPAGGASNRLWCRACDAFFNLVFAQVESDSLMAAERTAREWIRRRPGDWRPWVALSDVYEVGGRLDDARAARRESARLLGHDPTDGVFPADAIFRTRLALHAGAFLVADRVLDGQVASSDARTRAAGLWWRVISLRQQGRLHDALQHSQDLIREEEALPGPHEGGSLGRIARAQTTFEVGQPRQAAALFEAIAAAPIVGDSPLLMPGRSARRGAWMLTHAATAYAAAGDTAQLVRLGEAVEQFGRRTANGRDRRLHHYVRALLLEARQDWAGAERELRLAVSSPNLGYTRINLELARTLVAQARPREAIPVLQSALRGGLEGSNFYVTHTELHEALGRAFTAAGERDSARVHNAEVAAAWTASDAPFRQRAAHVRE
jgi:DNA-binding SARP family transcriptional activator